MYICSGFNFWTTSHRNFIIGIQIHRRRKWNFRLNFRNSINWTSPFLLYICNAINWAGAFSKAFSSLEALISYSLKMPPCMIIFKFLSVKNTVHCTNIQMVMSGYQFINLQFVHLSKNMPTEHQLLVRVLAYRKYCSRWFNIPLGLAKETISVLWNFCNLFIFTRILPLPSKDEMR